MKLKHWGLISLYFLPALAIAAPGIPALSISADQNGQEYSLSLQILALMTGLTLLPAFLMAMTSFTRIIIVLGILRQAMGMAQTPTNQILIGISLFMTFFIMAPTFEAINTQSVQPYLAGKLSGEDAINKAQNPIRMFMLNQTRKNDLELFQQMAGNKTKNLNQLPLSILMPAFLTSELKTAFQIGFILFLPFLIIDLVVASVLMAMGMMMLSPLIISLPFKIMLFVLVDGWTLVLGSLATSFMAR